VIRSLLLAVWVIFLISLTMYGAVDWRPIDPEDLASKTPKVEKDADAEALFWDIWLDDNQLDKTIFTHYLRVKIFTARGVEAQSRIDLPYIGTDRIADIVARTIKPDGNIVELKKDAVFERTLIKAGQQKIKAKSFVMPGVEPGAIVEYRWREEVAQSPNYTRLQFQREIPVRAVKYYIKPFSGLTMVYQTFHMPNIPLTREKDGFNSFLLTEVPAFHSEPRMPPEAQVRPWILVYYQSQTKSSEAYWTDWGKYAFDLNKQELKFNDDVKRAAMAAIGDAGTPEEKLRRLFDFCRSKIIDPYDDVSRYRDQDLEKLKDNRSPADTLKRGLGTRRQIDLLFGAMAGSAGFDVRLAHMPDRGDIFFAPNMTSASFLTRYNVAVKVGSEWRFFDPANRYATFGMLAWREEGEPALIPDPKVPMWVTTPLSLPNRSVEKRTGRLKLMDDGTLEGDVEIAYTGHFAVDAKEFYRELTGAEQEEQVVKMVKDRMSTAEVSAVTLENVKDPDKLLTVRYHVRVSQYAQRTGTRLFFQPGFFQRGQPALFASATRTYPIYFHYPWSEEDDISIDLPAGFDVDSVESPGRARAADTASHEVFMQLAEERGNRALKYQRRMAFGLNGAIAFPVEAYKDLKAVFDEFHQRDDYTLTLKAGVNQ
jgi:hypothetical protein